MDLGARYVRVRQREDHAVVEIDPESRAVFFRHDGYRGIVAKMEELGFIAATIDEKIRRSC